MQELEYGAQHVYDFGGYWLVACWIMYLILVVTAFAALAHYRRQKKILDRAERILRATSDN